MIATERAGDSRPGAPGGDSRPGAPGGDRGLQPERTRLAWRRTALTATAVSLLAARLALGTRPTTRGALGVAAVAVLWLAVVTVCQRRMRALAVPGPTTAGRSPSVLAAAVLGYALLGVAMLALCGG